MSRHRKGMTSTSELTMLQNEKARVNGKIRLLDYHEIPPWQQENEYVLTGYRPTSGSVRRSLESLLYLNNETGTEFIFGLFELILTTTTPILQSASILIYLERFYSLASRIGFIQRSCCAIRKPVLRMLLFFQPFSMG